MSAQVQVTNPPAADGGGSGQEFAALERPDVKAAMQALKDQEDEDEAAGLVLDQLEAVLEQVMDANKSAERAARRRARKETALDVAIFGFCAC